MCNFGFQPEALNRAFLDIFEELLVLQNFFSCKITPPALQKPFLKIQRVPLLDVEKKILQIKFLSFGPFGFAKTVFAVRGGNFA